MSTTIRQLSSTGYAPRLIPEVQPIVDHLLASVPPHWIEDLCTLSWQFYDQQAVLLDHTAVLNPTFAGSAHVQGADADMILNTCLMEIKTTVKAQLKGEWIYQLLGYVLLDYADQYGIQDVAIYMARQGVVLRWTLDALLTCMSKDTPPPLDRIRAHFQQVVTTTIPPKSSTG